MSVVYDGDTGPRNIFSFLTTPDDDDDDVLKIVTYSELNKGGGD